MFNMPITFGVERSISLPPAFILPHYHYAIRDDVDIDFGFGDFGNFFGIFARILRKVPLLGYRNLLQFGLAFKYDRFPDDIRGHEKTVVFEPHQNRVAPALTHDA